MIKETKNNINKEKICYDLLTKVFIGGAYSQIELNKVLKEVEPRERAYITRLFYGCIEKSIQFDRIIKDLTQKPPQKPVAIVLKMGLYLIRYTDTPAYAAIDKTVTLIKSTPKSALSGFVNAFLKNSLEYALPDELSVALSCPDWLIQRLKKRYNDEFIVKLMGKGDTSKTHIRHNQNKISIQKFEQKLRDFTRSPLGYWVDYAHLNRLNSDEYVIQSLSSMLAVEAYLSSATYNSSSHSSGVYKNVLDLCGAPGGKSVYLKQLSPNSGVICCDNQPHRVGLIEKYAAKYGAKIAHKINDATQENPDWFDLFDLCVCDVPCSGFGVKGKPDIFLNRKEEDIKELNALQLKIMDTAKKYVKRGGILCYSTCTVLKEENEDVIGQFLSLNPDFKLEPIESKSIKSSGMFNIYPQNFGSDAFFVCRLRRL